MAPEASDDTNVTVLLRESARGDREASNRLLTAVYAELRRLAGRLLATDGARRSVAPTELVNDAAMKLIDMDRIDWRDRRHFFAVAAGVMRQVLVDHVRHERAAKRRHQAVTLTTAIAGSVDSDTDRLVEIEVVDRALTRLAELSATQAKVVEMRFFAGLTIEEIADALGLSESTAKRAWRAGRAWLHENLERLDA